MSKPYVSKPPYPAQFRQQMVELVQAGRNPNELAREFGCHATSILSWVRKARLNLPAGAATLAVPLGTSERQELVELRRKVRQLQMERDILSKATAWFAGRSEPTLTASTR
jgi:transposase